MNDLIDSIAEELEILAPTIQNILDQRSLKWIFVGGKGGVGKTTCSSAIATLLSKVRESVLIISTDPAHNLSDAFRQKFTSKPALVNNFDNLYAMEIDPTFEHDATTPNVLNDQDAGLMKMIKEIATSLPGIDEAMGFAEVMKQVQNFKFETIIFDTAPTGHTLRLLSFPSVMEKAAGQILNMKSKFSGLFSQFSSFFGNGGQGQEPNDLENKMTNSKNVIESINKEFKDPNLTTFICVCIPEFLSLYETERLVQELTKFEIDVSNIIINQVLFPEIGSHCSLCSARSNMQNKYVMQIEALYQDFHVLKLPLLCHEIRGTFGAEGLVQFSDLMLNPYELTWHSEKTQWLKDQEQNPSENKEQS